MKLPFTSALFALVGFLGASRPALAAPAKTDERTAALVAILRSVSPDPLGGRLGFAASAPRTATAPVTAASSSRGLAVQMSRAVLDQRAYVIWKSSRKS